MKPFIFVAYWPDGSIKRGVVQGESKDEAYETAEKHPAMEGFLRMVVEPCPTFEVLCNLSHSGAF